MNRVYLFSFLPINISFHHPIRALIEIMVFRIFISMNAARNNQKHTSITGCLFSLYHNSTTAQNVGVNTTNPTERLDVNGNINVTGTIKANGIDGSANQVLMKNGSGNLAWGDLCEYKNAVTLFNASGTWNVPAGVTRIFIEVWGAGGGGNRFWRRRWWRVYRCTVYSNTRIGLTTPPLAPEVQKHNSDATPGGASTVQVGSPSISMTTARRWRRFMVE